MPDASEAGIEKGGVLTRGGVERTRRLRRERRMRMVTRGGGLTREQTPFLPTPPSVSVVGDGFCGADQYAPPDANAREIGAGAGDNSDRGRATRLRCSPRDAGLAPHMPMREVRPGRAGYTNKTPQSARSRPPV